MNVLCVDKTGTITEGIVRLHSAIDAQGRESEKVHRYAYVNASFESGFANPIDDTIRAARGFDLTAFRKLDEIPYDFIRKRLSVVVTEGERRLLITKGAVKNVLDVCTSVELADGTRGYFMIAGLNALAFHRGIFRSVAEWGEGIEPPKRARFAGTASCHGNAGSAKASAVASRSGGW